MKILEPLRIGNITLKNRVMFPPLTTGYEQKDGSIGEQSLNFYTRLAEGGAAYIVIGDVTPIMTISPTPKLFDDNQIPSYKKLAENLHQYDCKLGLQIFYPEYRAEEVAKLFYSGKSDEGFKLLHYDMKNYINEVSEESLKQILVKIGDCVKRAAIANVDVIEIHGDRLVGSLCSTILNKRTDKYGGIFENRIRFALEVVKIIKNVAPQMAIDYKLPVVTLCSDKTLRGKGGLIIDEAVKFACILQEAGVDTIHVAQANHTGNMNDTIPAMGSRDYAFMLEETKAIKKAVKIPVSMVGRVTTAKVANALIEQGVCDFVGLGRSLLADPDFINKLSENNENLIRHCIMCNKGCTDNIQNRRFLSCVLNAENGYEYKRVLTKSTIKKSICVVGAGVAGLEVARVASLRGHHVDIYDRQYRIGGQVNIACVPPRKEEMRRILNYYENNLKNQDVNIYLGCEFNDKIAEKYDEVVIAVGAKNARLDIQGINLENVVDAWDILDNKEIAYGTVCVAGGGLVGTEVAEYLATKGLKVKIIEMQDKIAKEESNTILPQIMANFKKYDVDIFVNHKILEFTSQGVRTLNISTNCEEFINCDTIVNALASVANKLEINSRKIKVYYCGDCDGEKPSTIEHAIKTAYDIAIKL